jgi:hypothetical protein
MKVVFIGEGNKENAVRGLMDMSQKELAGRLDIVFSRFEVDSKGSCTPLAENKRALFLILVDEEISAGEFNAQYYKGIRLDDPSKPMKTSLVCVRTTRVLNDQQRRFHGVRAFLEKIRAGHKPSYEEVPEVLLNIKA